MQIFILLPHGCESVNVSSPQGSPRQWAMNWLCVCVVFCYCFLSDILYTHKLTDLTLSHSGSSLKDRSGHPCHNIVTVLAFKKPRFFRKAQSDGFYLVMGFLFVFLQCFSV